VSFEAWNRYVLGAIGLLAVVFYLAVVLWGISELISRMPKPSTRRKRSKTAGVTRRLPNTRKSS
jgi:Na+-transporting methylmalonyl-CoA/oxaloacetate decarboxylase gamma subunit